MKILKTREPGIYSCGTSVLIAHHEIKDGSIFILCFQLVR